MITEEFEINIPEFNLTTRGIKWCSNPNATPTIALHGWLDNAATFELIAPNLKNQSIYSIDFFGHGKSDHLPEAANYNMTQTIQQVIHLSDAMGFEKFNLLGHSLGACAASLVAGTIPDRINKVILIDGLGPLTRKDEDLPFAFENYLKQRHRLHKKNKPTYTSIEEAAKDRAAKTQITYASALILARRGIKKEGNTIKWVTDPLLTLPSPQKFTEKQVLAFLERITAETLFISAKNGYPYKGHQMDQRIKTVKKIKTIILDGRHHLHLDTPEETLDEIQRFLSKI